MSDGFYLDESGGLLLQSDGTGFFLLSVPPPASQVRDQVEIDWANDGYRSTSADVTQYLHSYWVDYGMDTRGDEAAFRDIPARGRLVLANEGQRFSTESQNAFDVSALRKPHNCRILSLYPDAPARVLWEGIARPPVTNVRGGADQARFELTGKLAQPYRERYAALDLRGRTVAQLAADQTDALGTPPTIDVNAQGTGLVTFPPSIATDDEDFPSPDFQGNRQGYLAALARYAGAWSFEDRLGSWTLRSHNRLVDIDALLTVSPTTHWIDSDNSRVWRNIRIVKNHSHFEQWTLVSVPTPELTFSVAMPAGTSEEISLSAGVEGAVLTAWPSLQTLTQKIRAAAGTSNIAVAIVKSGGNSISLRLTNNGSEDAPFFVNLGSVTAQKIAVARTQDFSNDASEETYLRQSVFVPPWFNNEAFAWGRTWLTAISEPLTYAEVQLPRRQPTLETQKQVETLAADTMFNLAINDISGGAAAGKYYVLGASLVRDFDRSAYIALYSIGVSDIGANTGIFILGNSKLGTNRLGAEG